MFITRFGLNRPVVVRMALIVIVVLGIYSYRAMPRYLDPDLTIGEGLVITIAEGFSPEEMEKLVTNKIEGDWSVITVKDTGPGIAKQHRERIFDTFWQADGSATRDYEGTGLGLAISRKLVDLHGGEFWLDEDVASGSTFHIRLPKAKPVETAEIAAE